MKKIAVFGCSFTSGIDPEYHSWAKCLANSRPDIEVHDYSKGGSSLKWSISQLLRSKSIDYDYRIFQITTSRRITLEPPDISYKRFYEHCTTNYRRYNTHLAEQIATININYIPRQSRNFDIKFLSKLYKNHYKSMYLPLEELEYTLYIKYLIDNVDFAFFHKESDRIESQITKIESVENVIGTNQYKKYVYDDGDHFGEDGVKAVCNWVLSQTNL